MPMNRWNWSALIFNKIRFQSVVILLSCWVISFFAVSNTIAATSDVFPSTQYAGMQVEYSIEGVAIGTPVDDIPPYPCSSELCLATRTYKGTFTPGTTLTLWGIGKFQPVSNNTGDLRLNVSPLYLCSPLNNPCYQFSSSSAFSHPFKFQVKLPQKGEEEVSLSVGVVTRAGGSGYRTTIYFELSISQGSDDLGSTRGGKDANPNTVHDGGNGPAKCSVGGLPNYWINTSSLNLAVQDSVCKYPGRGPQLAMTHSWNSVPSTSTSSMFGKGWRFAYESGVSKTATGATLMKGSGQELKYTGSTTTSPSVLTPPSGFLDTLTWNGTYWILVEKSTKWSYRFDKSIVNGQTSDTEYRLTSITDTNGNAVTFDYTASGMIQTITDATGRETSFTYDANNHVTAMDAPDGRFATYQYDGSGNMTQSVDLLGTKTDYVYDANGLMTSMTVGDKTATFTYTSVNNVMRVASVKDANGHTTKYAMSGQKVTKTDPLGNITTYTGTTEGFTSSVTDPLSNTFTTQYANGNPVSFTDALGYKTTRTFDARGNVTKVTDSKGYATTYTYDANDNLTSVTDALGKKTTFTYDAKNNLVKITSPLNNQTAMAYDDVGQLTGITDSAGKKTTFTHTSHGNVASATDPLGNQTTYQYDDKGINRTAMTDPRGNKTTFTYDSNNRLTRVTHPDGKYRTYTYDCCAMTSVTDENGHTTNYTRDKVLNLTKLTDPLGSLTEMSYDGNDNLTQVIDPLLRGTTIAYDKANRRIQQNDPLSGSIKYSYDSNGKMTTLTDERSKSTKFFYDTNNQLVKNTDPINASTIFTRDELGRVKQILTPKSDDILYHFDDDGRMIDKSFNTKNAATFTYDVNGNMVSVKDASGTTVYAYNARNELTGITWQDGASATFAYDKAGNVAGVQYPGGLLAAYEYDSRNRVQKMTWAGMTISFKYDSAGNLVQMTRSNNTTSEYTYDNANRLTGVNHKKGTSSIANMQYTRDAVGNIVSEKTGSDISGTSSDENRDGVYNDVNQTVTWGSDAYVYDLNGNVSSVTGARPLTAAYDPENRLLSLNLAGTASTYMYDGLGNRIKKTQGTAVTNYHYDHLGRLLFETDQTGKTIAFYCYAGAALMAMQTANGVVYCYHFDKTGNTIAMTDASGNVANAYQYDAFGKVRSQSGTVRNMFTYIGAFGVMDEGGGVYYMKNRYYDASLGKFFQKDPIGFAGEQSNLYDYVGNNPVERIDPEGLFGAVAAEFIRIEYNSSKTSAQIPLAISEERMQQEINIMMDKFIREKNPNLGNMNYLEIAAGCDSNYFHDQHNQTLFSFRGRELTGSELNYYFFGMLNAKYKIPVYGLIGQSIIWKALHRRELASENTLWAAYTGYSDYIRNTASKDIRRVSSW